ncbi:unnamed protein product [Phytophthora lilii]|uniref:Unnamed protein product n=1 Tax=Phytophthora lilii TaxID=2077276 RepID=A0A9W6TFU6_9STRA|nr:unnamed protein product [Phytophthora lilii]
MAGNVPLGATVDREYAELADAPDIANGEGCPIDTSDTEIPDREIDEREKPRWREPLDFFEYSDVGVGLGVEAADGFEYSELGAGFAFALDCLP